MENPMVCVLRSVQESEEVATNAYVSDVASVGRVGLILMNFQKDAAMLLEDDRYEYLAACLATGDSASAEAKRLQMVYKTDSMRTDQGGSALNSIVGTQHQQAEMDNSIRAQNWTFAEMLFRIMASAGNQIRQAMSH